MSKSIRTTVTATLLVGVVGLALAGCASSDPTSFTCTSFADPHPENNDAFGQMVSP